MTDDELLDGLLAGTLAPADFRHREHVRAAWACLARWGRAGAEQRLMAGLAHPGAVTFEQLAAVRPDLLDARLLRRADTSA